MKFKAAILVEQQKPLVVDQIEWKHTLEYGQLLVRVHYTGVCGSQLGEIDGVKGPDPYLPHLLGHEAGGVVQEVGPGVKSVKAGDAVVLHWRKGAGIEAATPKFHWNGRVVNAGWVTTFSEYTVVSENRVTAVPKGFDLKIAALYGCAIPTGFGSVFNDAHLKIGESIAVFGVGGVGLATLLAAKLSSAYPIIGVDIYDHKLVKAKTFGATHLINSRTQDVKAAIQALLPQGVDVAIDNTGVRLVRELAYELTSKQGRTILVGVPHVPGEKMSIESLPLHFTKTITGSWGGNIDPAYFIPRMLRLQQAQALPLAEMISHSFTLDKINDAIAAMRQGDVIRCSIDMAA